MITINPVEANISKSILRERILRLRNSQRKRVIREKSKIIADKLLGCHLFKRAKVVMFYATKENEVDTREMIEHAMEESKRVIVPITRFREGRILPSEILDYDSELEVGKFGIPEPKFQFVRPVDPKEIDLVIVPGVVFDVRGHRIGYGGGFYDRFLKELRPEVRSIGLAFEFQLYDKLPNGENDVPVDFIISEERIIDCAKELRRK